MSNTATPSTHKNTENIPAKKNKTKISVVHLAKSKYSKLEGIPTGLNQNLTSPKADFYKILFGEPRIDKVYSTRPSVATNPALLKICKTENVGPFRATGLKPAVDSLKKVMNETAKIDSDLVARFNNDGMLVVRYVDGTTCLSNHSWGAAIDLKVDGIRDEKKDDKVLHGLALIAPIFNNHGWYSGAGYKPKKNKKTGKVQSNEDAMHFEVSKEKLLEWAQAGLLGRNAEKVARGIKVLKPGARGPEVRKVQEALKKHVPATPTHGKYDRMTERAVKVVQDLFGMPKTGIICKKLLRKLKVIIFDI